MILTFVMLWSLTACTPMHMAVPAELDGGVVLPVGGRGDLRGGYTIGGFRVSPQPRGFVSHERSDYVASTPTPLIEPFTLVITAPDGGTNEVACELRATFQSGFNDTWRYADGQVECTGEGVVLSWQRAADKMVTGSVSVGGEAFAFTPVVNIAGDDFQTNAGAMMRRGETAVAAVERLPPGQVTLASGAGANAERAAVILLAVVITTEDTLSHWTLNGRTEASEHVQSLPQAPWTGATAPISLPR